jgi:alkylation response protein AidB-like acyl-CoA dehydrogenase
MNFNLSEEQQMLKDSIVKFVRDNYELPKRLAQQKKDMGYSEEHWQTFAELGWLAMPFPEEFGGLNGTAIDTMVMMEEFGKGLILEPFFATVVLAGTALKLGGTQAQKEKIIPEIIQGSVKATLAYAELQARHNLADVATTASKQGNDYIIKGQKSMVWNAQTADYIIVSARTSGARADKNGISLFLVPATAEGVSRKNLQTIDGLRASEIEFNNVKVSASDLIGELNNGYTILEQVALHGILALSAEAVGAMEKLYKDTVDYTKQRVQFDHPLSEFQTVKHRLAEMFTETEQSRSMLFRATMEMDNGAEDAALDIHGLKYLIGKNGRFIGQSAVQLHGGMGQTEELRIGHYFIRLTVIDSQFGDTDYHLEQFSQKMAIPEGEASEFVFPI